MTPTPPKPRPRGPMDSIETARDQIAEVLAVPGLRPALAEELRRASIETAPGRRRTLDLLRAAYRETRDVSAYYAARRVNAIRMIRDVCPVCLAEPAPGRSCPGCNGQGLTSTAVAEYEAEIGGGP